MKWRKRENTGTELAVKVLEAARARFLRGSERKKGREVEVEESVGQEG